MKTTNHLWIHRDTALPGRGRVFTYSPVYQEGHEMRFSMMNAEFVRIATEVTHWMYPEYIKPNLEVLNG